MSSPIWTHDALSSEATTYDGECWRLVEAQHLVSTQKLVDSLAEQQLLEELIDATKPAFPPECRHLDYLLATPFRYDAVYPEGSRFRRAGRTLGVYYAAEHPETAVAELAFYRLLFFAESPDTPWPDNPGEFTAFSVKVTTEHALDLTAPRFSESHELWTHPTNYGPCQDFAGTARAANIEIIRYQSVRDPEHRANLALLSGVAFAETAPRSRATWRIGLSKFGVRALCEFPRLAIEFECAVFMNDPRIQNMRWDR